MRATGGAGPLIIGHRGASALATENTVEAFERARRDGADGVELDVLCCRSNEVVVFHDDDLARLAGRPQRVADLTLDELRAVELHGGARIPTLAEALEASGPQMLVNVELKTDGLLDRKVAGVVERVAAVIEGAGAAARIVVSSFNPLAIRRWQRHRPQIKAALLFEAPAARPLRRAWALPWLRPFGAHPEHVLCDERSVAGWHRAGYAVNTWTVDDPARLRALRDLGVDGIITNDPAAARIALSVNQ